MSAYHYHRGSIFWALTLIAVGGLFLYQNFNPDVHPWQLIAKFWPALIIFWGFSKLFDYIEVQRHPDLPHPSLFSGSEVVLLILILIFGTLISKVVLHPWQQWGNNFGFNHGEFADMFLSSYSYTKTISVPAKPGDRITILNRQGDVEINGSDKNGIEGVIKGTVRAEDESTAKRIAGELKVDMVEQDGTYILKSNLDSLPHSGRNVRLNISLRVPHSTLSDITTDRGDLIAQSLDGDQTFTDKHGDFTAKDIHGLVRIKKEEGATQVKGVNGDVELQGSGGDVGVSDVTGTLTINGEFSGTVQIGNVAQLTRFTSTRTNLTAQKISGQLTMDLGSLDANGIGGPFQVATRQKDISLKGFKYAVKVVDVNGDVRLSPASSPKYPIEVDLRRGSIELALPASSAFQIDAHSDHGDVESNFPGLSVSKGGDNPSITGTTGNGGPSIKLSTTYGTIRLVRQSGGTATGGESGSEARLAPIPSSTPQPMQ